MLLTKTAAAFAVLAFACGLDLQKPKAHHHHHHKHSKTALVATEAAQSANAGAKLSPAEVSEKILSASLEHEKKVESQQAAALSAIDEDIAASWKQKAYLLELQHTIGAEEALLKQQMALQDASTGAFAVDAAKSEVTRTKEMVDEARRLMLSSRQAAMKRAVKAIEEAKVVGEAAAREEKLNDQAEEEAKKLKESAEKITARAKNIQDKALEEQRFFHATEGEKKAAPLDQITAQVVASL
mmetsp:Transcript_5616/g.10029  ORF Transcript_5616/g.10029 Transcript_5616/m.10029 type:complete len:241 (-) Transcript_5616:62-784(-)